MRGKHVLQQIALLLPERGGDGEHALDETAPRGRFGTEAQLQQVRPTPPTPPSSRPAERPPRASPESQAPISI